MRTPIYKICGTIILLISCVLAHTQQTDKVYLKNGDVITGEMKSMKLAKLSFDMNGPGIIYIKWEQIINLTSNRIFQVSLQNGQVLVSKLDSVFFKQYDIILDDIVEIVPIRNKFLKRLSGDINLGFNYTKSSEILQFNFGSSITYRVPKIESNFKLSAVLSKSSGDTITSKNQDAGASVLKTLNRRRYTMGTLGWERNTQLALQNRYLLGGVYGKMIISDNSERFLTGGGLSYNREQFIDSSEFHGNLEALIAIEYKKFRYSFPKINIDAQYKFYTGLSDWGRIRMSLSLTTSIEIFKDFNAGFTFYDNYDSRPSLGAASKNDFGINFTITYVFGK